jgi:hypothetical protein
VQTSATRGWTARARELRYFDYRPSLLLAYLGWRYRQQGGGTDLRVASDEPDRPTVRVQAGACVAGGRRLPARVMEINKPARKNKDAGRIHPPAQGPNTRAVPL